MSQELLEKKQRLEQLKRDKEERERLKKQKELENQGQQKKPSASNNEFVQKILQDSAPLTSNRIEEMIHGSSQQNYQQENELKEIELKFSSFVIEIEVLPKPKAETYDRQIQVDLIEASTSTQEKSKPNNYDFYNSDNLNSIQGIDNQSMQNLGTVVQVGLIQTNENNGGVAPSVNQLHYLNNQEGMNQLRGDRKMEDIDGQVKKDVSILSKEESKQVMKTKEFENFINKTSKIVERALNTNIDILGSFFDDNSDDVNKNLGSNKGDKITAQFTFQDSEPMKRAITSIEWSPKISISQIVNSKISKNKVQSNQYSTTVKLFFTA